MSFVTSALEYLFFSHPRTNNENDDDDTRTEASTVIPDTPSSARSIAETVESTVNEGMQSCRSRRDSVAHSGGSVEGIPARRSVRSGDESVSTCFRDSDHPPPYFVPRTVRNDDESDGSRHEILPSLPSSAALDDGDVTRRSAALDLNMFGDDSTCSDHHILSSANASTDTAPNLLIFPSEDVPRAHSQRQSFSSLSTIESRYTTLPLEYEYQLTSHIPSAERSESDASSLSLRPSMFGSSLTLDRRTTSTPDIDSSPLDTATHVQNTQHNHTANTPSHHLDSLLVVGHHLLRIYTPDTLVGTNDGSNEWWTTFTERDWESMKEASKYVYSIMEKEFHGVNHLLPVLPPLSPSPLTRSITIHNDYKHVQSKIFNSLILPQEFLCPVCNDVIVGAVTLDCACSLSTFCTNCFESATADPVAQHNSSKLEEEDYVLVDKLGETIQEGIGKKTVNTLPRCCPSCRSHCTRAVPCHALDVAIFHTIRGMSLSNYLTWEDVTTFQHEYYDRLRQWRGEVQNRHCAASLQRDRRCEIMMSILIQMEEEIFWSDKRKCITCNDLPRRSSCSDRFLRREKNEFRWGSWEFWGEMTILVAAAAMATMGVQLLSKR